MDFMCGFETEFVGTTDRDELGEKIAKDLMIPLSVGQKNYQVWSLVKDASIKIHEPNTMGHEIISPPMKLEESFLWMNRLFDWLEYNKCYTNDSCGFHINLSFIEDFQKQTPRGEYRALKIHKLDRLKLVCLLDEEKILNQFKREANSYCNSWRNVIANFLTYCEEAFAENGVVSKENLMAILDDTKYRTVNFSKQRYNYIEFRLLGGHNYHLRMNDIKACVDHFCEVLEASCHTELMANRYRDTLPTIIKKLK